MPLIVCLRRCAARHGAGTRSIAFCSASATTWPMSRPGSRPTSRARSWPPSTASAVEKNENSSLFWLVVLCCRRHRLRRSQMGTFKCRTTTERAPRPAHASRSPSRAAFPPASTSRPLFCLSASTSRLLCAKPTAPTHLDENDHDGPHVSAANLVVITTDTESIISSAGGAGRLA